MNEIFEPEKQFLERLEWQLSSEYRRTNRLKSPTGKVTLSRRVVAAGLMVGTLMTGVAMIKATEYLRDSWRKKIEMARIETEVKLKEAQLESTREIASRIEAQFANGLIREQEHLAMQVALEKAKLDLQKSQLNLEEVYDSGKTPRDELYAPLVRGQDFVSQRLQLDMRDFQLDAGQIQSHYEYYKNKVELGILGEGELNALQAEMTAQNANISTLQQKLDLRSRFLAGELTAQEVEILDRLSLAERNLNLAQSKVTALSKSMNELETRVDMGVVNDVELTQIRYALSAAQAELDLAVLELDVLRTLK